MRSERQRIAARRVAAEIAELENEINEAEMADAQAALDARTLEEKDTVDVPVPTVEASRMARRRKAIRKARIASLYRRIRKAAIRMGLENNSATQPVAAPAGSAGSTINNKEIAKVQGLIEFIQKNKSAVAKLFHGQGAGKTIDSLLREIGKEVPSGSVGTLTGREMINLFYDIVMSLY